MLEVDFHNIIKTVYIYFFHIKEEKIFFYVADELEFIIFNIVNCIIIRQSIFMMLRLSVYKASIPLENENIELRDIITDSLFRRRR